MNIKEIRATPLRFATKIPYIWAQGGESAFTVNLIEIEADDGTIGIGETTTAPDADAQRIVLAKLARSFVGKSVFDFAQCRDDAFKRNFTTFGGNMPRYANQMFSGLEMAALDLQGKLLGRPVWDLLGGQRRGDVGYFAFLQGATLDDIIADAKAVAAADHPIVYLKVGIGEEYDVAAVRGVREAIGDRRLRVDANEAWDPATAMKMIEAFRPYGVEYIEQPTKSWSTLPLRQVTERSPIAIGADQSVFTTHDVFRACASGAADMIAIGPREAGGLAATMKAAAIAEAAGLNICIHSSMTTGITTCAEHHLGRAIPNLDDGNQIMWQLLLDNVVESPNLSPVRGRLALDPTPGLGFTLNDDVVAKAAEAHETFRQES